jgi:small GTP-binding protein
MNVALPTSYKIVVRGSSGVGKSSIVQRLVLGTFDPDRTMTCGADFYSHATSADGQAVKLQIWDTAGQERFRAISKAYFRNAVACVLVFDITSSRTFDELGEWLTDFEALAAPNAYALLVANKVDLENSREVGEAEVRAFAERHELHVVETSAASGRNIAAAFARLTTDLIARTKSGQITLPQIEIEPTRTLLVKRKRKCCG